MVVETALGMTISGRLKLEVRKTEQPILVEAAVEVRRTSVLCKDEVALVAQE